MHALGGVAIGVVLDELCSDEILDGFSDFVYGLVVNGSEVGDV